MFKAAGSQQNDLKERLRRKLTILKEEKDELDNVENDKEGLRIFCVLENQIVPKILTFTKCTVGPYDQNRT